MKKNFIKTVAAVMLVLCLLAPLNVLAAAPYMIKRNGYEYYASANFAPPMGEINLVVKHNFDFINTDSSKINWDLALTGVTLSEQVYKDRNAEKLLSELGYDVAKTTKPFGSDKNQLINPVASMGYKHITGSNGKGKNIFAIVVRGTSNNEKDIPTDIFDGGITMFDSSRGNIAYEFKEFIKNNVKRSVNDLKKEDNYFFLTGHSLGGAVINALSVDETIMSLSGNNKGHIYTYTFESPHTCINLWWEHVEERSNAFNFKDQDDGVTYLPPWIGSTTYGKDVMFSVNTLNNKLFKKLFPNAKGGNVYEATTVENHGDVFGHHDLALGLVYVIQNGLKDGWWKELYFENGHFTMWKDVFKQEEPTTKKFEEATADSDLLIGDWSTSDGVYLSFYDDGSFCMEWGYFPEEIGYWKTEPLTDKTLFIELDGSSVLSVMSLIYGTTLSDYHFEVLKCNDDNFYLVQVYDDKTAITSPCKLGFTRDGAKADFSY